MKITATKATTKEITEELIKAYNASEREKVLLLVNLLEELRERAIKSVETLGSIEQRLSNKAEAVQPAKSAGPTGHFLLEAEKKPADAAEEAPVDLRVKVAQAIRVITESSQRAAKAATQRRNRIYAGILQAA